MACCLMPPSHYLNHYWFIISTDKQHSHKGNGTGNAHESNHYNAFEITLLKSKPHPPGDNELIPRWSMVFLTPAQTSLQSCWEAASGLLEAGASWGTGGPGGAQQTPATGHQPQTQVQSSLTSRDHSVYGPSQWEMGLHCNAISHWLGAYTMYINGKIFKYNPWCLYYGGKLKQRNVHIDTWGSGSILTNQGQ